MAMRRAWLLLLLSSCSGGQESQPAGAAPAKPPAVAAVAAPVDAGPGPAAASPPSAGPTSEPSPAVEIPPDMLPVPEGTFPMGADDEGEQDERPLHRVTVRGFLLDETEVTNEAYLECVRAGACKPPRDGVAEAMGYGSDSAYRGARQPVVGVSWFDAKAYCEHVGKRLPTEAEWERAARGDDGRRFVWGDEPPSAERAAFSASSGGRTSEVGSFPAGRGPYGHLDLAGNVWEWVEDAYDPYAYKRPTADRGVPGSCDEILAAQDELRRKNQQGYTGSNPIPTECERVLRGGAFNYHAAGLRASNRVHHPARFRILVAGFRCARDVPLSLKAP